MPSLLFFALPVWAMRASVALIASGLAMRKDLGTRASGVVLAAAALWGLWMDVGQRVAAWCVS